MNTDLACLLHDLPAHIHSRPLLPPPPSPPMHRRSSHCPSDWRSQSHQSALFAGPFAPSSWANAGPSQPSFLWSTAPPEFLLPFQPRDYQGTGYSLARSDTSSAVSRDSDLSPSPEVAEVVCNAPLVAPIPLPYHSPTFLLYDLPDDDEDLSHPPYTHRPHKRKRARDEHDDAQDQSDTNPAPAKRRSIAADARQWNAANVGQWASTAPSGASTLALRHPPAGFSRRNRAR